MTANDILEVTQQMKIGDKILFKHNFEKWRLEKNLPLPTLNTHNDSPDSLSTISSCTLSQSSNELNSENENLVLLDILKHHKHGCKILELYETSNKITEEQRACLINIIVQYFESKDIHMSLQTSHQLESQILKIFPTEKLEYYRADRRGKIYVKYYNKKKLTKSLKDCQSDLPTTSSDVNYILVPEDDAHMYIQKLKFDNLSADEYNSAWAACRNYRLQQINAECHNIKEILNLWPQYKGPDGFKMIDSDFSKLFKKVPTIMSWDALFLKLLEYMQNQTIRDQNINKILTSFKTDEVNKDKDVFALKILWCLHYFLHPTKKFLRKNVKGKREYGRYTIRDSQEAFAYINSTMQSLDDHLNFLSKKGDPIQSFILCLGDNKTFKIDNFFLYLDGQLMLFHNFLRASDICFKAFHLFSVEYPLAFCPFWIFIEQYLYYMSKTKKKNTKASILLDELSKL